MEARRGDDNQAPMDLDAVPWCKEEFGAGNKLKMEINNLKGYTISLYKLPVMLIPLCTLFVAWQ